MSATMTRFVQLGDTGDWIKQVFINGVWVELRESGKIDSDKTFHEPFNWRNIEEANNGRY